MTDLPVLRSRQAIERRPTEGPSDALIEKAKMLAAAGPQALPKAYANNPGACMMALDWADRNDIPIFEVIGHVAFVHGKPVVEAVLQKKMAGRLGARTVVVDSSPTSATVKVVDRDGNEVNGEGNGRYTYTIEKARAYKLTDKDQYKADPEWMLIKRATTRALELHGPDEMATVVSDDEPDSPIDVLPPASETSAGDFDRVTGPGAPTTAGDNVELVATEAPAQPEAPTLNDVLEAAKAKGMKPAAVKAQAIAMGYEITATNQLMDNTEALMDLADWIDQQ